MVVSVDAPIDPNTDGAAIVNYQTTSMVVVKMNNNHIVRYLQRRHEKFIHAAKSWTQRNLVVSCGV